MKSALLPKATVLAILAVACSSTPPPAAPATLPSTTAPPAPLPPPAPATTNYDALPRAEVNRWAVRLNLPLYWIADANNNRSIDAGEVASLLFYPTSGQPASAWVADGALTPAFDAAYRAIVEAARAPAPTGPDAARQLLVGKDLDQGRATLVHSDLSALPPADKKFVGVMLDLAKQIDALYELQNGATALAEKLPADAASRSLFRRNRGAKCVGPQTETDPACSAIPGAPRPVFDIYPAALQADPKFCQALEKRPDAKLLLESHFSAVREEGGKLVAVPYSVAYQEHVTAIARTLGAAADAVAKDPAETALVSYLRAAAASFLSNDWIAADEAWAKMTVDNSKWYVRVGPDETYWEPCAQKAGVHLTFARINQQSKAWQDKLRPVQQEMEAAIAARAGKPYTARKVTFHLPDFIDIVINAGDDRDAINATIGQSLPNWGPVANQGRGRTVAMTNLTTDADSTAARRSLAESVLDAASMARYSNPHEAGLVNTILHEATHNLGPAHEYKVKNQTAGQRFGGPLASVMEELKAQTGGLYLVEMLRGKGLVSDELAGQTYTDAVVWAFGHISQGMYTGAREPKTYSQLAAIQIGFLLDRGALTWTKDAAAANGSDRGAFTIHTDKLVPAIHEMVTVVAGIKARGDRAAAEALRKKYVDASTVVPHEVIIERFRRSPRPSYVYSIRM